MKTLNAVILTAIFLFAPGIASAQYYDVCGTLTYFETRTDWSNVSGSKFTDSSRNTNRPLRWSQIHLYDQDGSCIDSDLNCTEPLDDDYLGTTTTDGSGNFCFSNIGGAEDVYLVFEYESNVGQVKWGSGAVPRTFTRTHWNFGNSVSSGTIYDIDFSATCFDQSGFVAESCQNRTDANNYPSQQGMANILAAMVDVDRWTTYSDLWPNNHSRKFIGYYGDRPGSASCSSQGTSWGQDEFCVVTWASDDNHVVVHELAHCLHRRYLDISGSLAGSCPGDWTGESPNNEKCAMSEGWANFFATAIYFHPHAQVPWYRGFSNCETEGDTTAGNITPNGAPVSQQCASFDTLDGTDPEDQEANVTRFFWDIFDSTTVDDDGSDNNSRQTLSTLMRVWDDFEGGSMPHPEEPGSNGRNIYDYKYAATYGTYSFGPYLVTEINHNCLGNSEPY